MSRFTRVYEWEGPSADPNDEQFGDVVRAVDPGDVIRPDGPADADAYAAALVGEPYDGAVVGRMGAAAGPRAVRDALAAVKTHHFDAGPVSAVADLGDVAALTRVDEASAPVSEVQSVVRDAAAEVHDADAFPVFVGGDNSLSFANAAPLLGRDGRLGVLSFDAHLDCREVRGEPTSGTPYRQLYEAGLDTLCVVGARHFETSTAYHDYLRERGGSVVTAEEVGTDPVEAAETARRQVRDCDRLYVSVDVDVLDAAYPGASAPTPGGLAPRELYRMLRLVAADDRVAGFEVVECAPPLDAGDRTAAAAARAVAHVLAARGT